LTSYQSTIKQSKLKEFPYNNIGVQMVALWYLITQKFIHYLQFYQLIILSLLKKKIYLVS